MIKTTSKYIALDSIIFEVGQTIIHKNLGYSATIKKICRRGNAIIEIPDTPANSLIWKGVSLPKSFKALNIAKTFKHQLKQPILNL